MSFCRPSTVPIPIKVWLCRGVVRVANMCQSVSQVNVGLGPIRFGCLDLYLIAQGQSLSAVVGAVPARDRKSPQSGAPEVRPLATQELQVNLNLAKVCQNRLISRQVGQKRLIPH